MSIEQILLHFFEREKNTTNREEVMLQKLQLKFENNRASKNTKKGKHWENAPYLAQIGAVNFARKLVCWLELVEMRFGGVSLKGKSRQEKVAGEKILSEIA